MNTLSTHILDISSGRPAQGVAVNLLLGGQTIASGLTDEQGRIALLAPEKINAKNKRLVAEIGDWFSRDGRETLYLSAQITSTCRF